MKRIGDRSDTMIIGMRHVPFVDATGMNSLYDTIKSLKSQGVKTIMLSGVRENVRRELDKGDITSLLGPDNIYALFDDAYEAVRKDFEV